MNRRIMTLEEVRTESVYYAITGDNTAGINALVDVENMGFCKDGVTRWYHFTDENGKPAVFFKHQVDNLPQMCYNRCIKRKRGFQYDSKNV